MLKHAYLLYSDYVYVQDTPAQYMANEENMKAFYNFTDIVGHTMQILIIVGIPLFIILFILLVIGNFINRVKLALKSDNKIVTNETIARTAGLHDPVVGAIMGFKKNKKENDTDYE